MKKIIVSTFIAAAAFVAMAGPASAHHPELEATVRCENGAYTIDVTVEAWATDEADRRHNNGISVQVIQRNVTVVAAGGALTKANDFRFTRSFTSLAQGHYVVRAESTRPWGPGEQFGSQGEYRDVLVVAEGPCPEYAERPTTTVKQPVVVEVTQPTVIGTPTVVERAPVAVAGEVVEAPVTLAFTGVELWQKALAAVGLLVAGLGAALAAKVARSKGVRAV